jgi:Zinc binding domain
VSGKICVWTQSDPDVGVIMYKASFKEPDPNLPPRCPRCGADGLLIGPETLLAHLASDTAESLGEPAYWCATDACPVAYFDLFERTANVDAAHGLYWPKDPAGPLCCCHGLTVDDVDADLAEPVPSRVRAVVQKAGQPDAACTTKSPDGRPCVARVQRYYMRQKQKG